MAGVEGGCPLDLRTAVAVSMLPVSRLRACAVFRELRQYHAHASVAQVLDALAVPDDERQRTEEQAWSRTDAAFAASAATGMQAIAWFDPRYPALLNCVDDPPPVIWVRGAVDALDRAAVAVIGSRAATTYALDVGARLGGELADRGVVVTSGLARGVDSAAHRGCLDAGGQTIA